MKLHVDNLIAPMHRDIAPFTPSSQAGHALRWFVSRREGAVAYCLDAAAYCRRMYQTPGFGGGHTRRGYLQMAHYWAVAARTVRQS